MFLTLHSLFYQISYFGSTNFCFHYSELNSHFNPHSNFGRVAMRTHLTLVLKHFDMTSNHIIDSKVKPGYVIGPNIFRLDFDFDFSNNTLDYQHQLMLHMQVQIHFWITFLIEQYIISCILQQSKLSLLISIVFCNN